MDGARRELCPTIVLLIVVASVTLALPASACGVEGVACPDVKCPNGIHVNVAGEVLPADEAFTVEACVGDDCVAESFPSGRIGMDRGVDLTVAQWISEPGMSWDVRVTVTVGEGNVVVRREEQVSVAREWVGGMKNCPSCITGYLEVSEPEARSRSGSLARASAEPAGRTRAGVDGG